MRNRLEELGAELDSLRVSIAHDDETLEHLLKELAPYFAAKREYANGMLVALATVVDDRTERVHLIGFRGDVIKVRSCRWVGPSGVVPGTCRGHTVECERSVIRVEGTQERIALRARFDDIHERYRPLLRRQRELRADIDAAVRAMNRVQELIDKTQKDTAKGRQLSFADAF